MTAIIVTVFFGAVVVGWAIVAGVYSWVIHKLDFDPENKYVGKIAVYGDVRSSIKIHRRIARLIASEKPGMVLFTGDIAANSHNFLHFLIYCLIEQRLWKNAEYYPTRGNHEDNIFYYKMFLDLPRGKTYYSFDRNDMHFIVLDVIDSWQPLDREQQNWLEKDLEAHKDKPITVSLHVPLYTSGKYEPYDSPYLRELFKKYNVLFVFCAHVHSYERSYADGVHYIVTAGGGAPLYPPTRVNPNKVVREQKHHYCILEGKGGEYSLTALDADGNIIDRVTASLKKRKEGNVRHDS